MFGEQLPPKAVGWLSVNCQLNPVAAAVERDFQNVSEQCVLSENSLLHPPPTHSETPFKLHALLKKLSLVQPPPPLEFPGGGTLLESYGCFLELCNGPFPNNLGHLFQSKC